MSNLLITCNGLVKIFKIGEFEVLALQGIELTVQAGEMVGQAIGRMSFLEVSSSGWLLLERSPHDRN